jgi:hypothetical protein
MQRILCVVVAVLSVLSGIAFCQSGSPEPRCEKPAQSAVRIERPDKDWTLGFIKKDRILKRSPFDSAPDAQAGFIATTYAVSTQSVLLPYITFNQCDRTAVVSSLILKPAGARGISKNGRTFAYLVWGGLVSDSRPFAEGIGADTNVVFYDVRGNGHFDTVQIGALRSLPFVPEWVK